MIRSSEVADLATKRRPRFLKIQATEPEAPMFPWNLSKTCRISLTVRLRLSVVTSTSTATPDGP